MELEKYVFENYISKILRRAEGKEYVLEEDLCKLNLTINEKNYLMQILKKRNISIELDVIKKEDRPKLVRDYTYGEVKEVQNRKNDVPEMAKFEYSPADELIYADYDELDNFLQKEFIPKNIQRKQRKNKETGEVEFYFSIQLNKILSLGYSEQEVEYIINYLDSLDIHVGGYNSTFDNEFGNYDYVRTYKSSTLPKFCGKLIRDRKLQQYRETPSQKLRNEIVEDNIRLVKNIAFKYALYTGIDVEELESYGAEGLIYAVERFDNSRNVDFATYAYACILGKIKRGVTKILGYPDNFYWDYLKWKNAVEGVRGEKVEENPDVLDDVLEVMAQTSGISYDSKKAYRNMLLLNHKQSLATCEGYKEPASTEDDFMDEVMTRLLRGELERALSTLTDRENKVLRLRFGLDDDRCRTHEEIGKEFFVTRERVRQIEAKALRKLKYPSCGKKLKEYL